jgi:hypothetical protein
MRPPARFPRSSWPTACPPSRRCTWTASPRRSPPGGWGRWRSTTGTSAPATASRARRSTHGRRCATTATRSPGRGAAPRSTPTASACGAPATAVAMCWSWSDRQAHQVRRLPGAAGQRVPQHPAAGAPGLPGPQPGSHGPGPRRPLPGGASGHGAGRRPRPAGRVGAAHPRLVGVVQRDRQAPRAHLEERGDAAQRRDADGVRAQRLPGADQPHAAADGCGRARPSHPTDLALEAYQRAREPKKLVLLPGGHFDAYVQDFETASGAARDWFLEHLGRSG